MASKRHLLIAMDAFGTLFSPRAPIAEQYIAIASKHGVHGLRTSDIQTSFNSSYKYMAQHYPNYGKNAGLNAEMWWKSVIERTFQPHVSEQQQAKILVLVPELIQRFWCADGYERHEDAWRFVQDVKACRRKIGATFDSVILGVLSNSDTRVPDILTSLGYRVSNLRTGAEAERAGDVGVHVDEDFQFAVMSYDVGHEKPAKEIFDATENLVRKKLLGEEHAEDDLVKLYVGDEWRKDGIGASNAGWHALVVERDNLELAKLSDLQKYIRFLTQANPREQTSLERVSSLH